MSRNIVIFYFILYLYTIVLKFIKKVGLAIVSVFLNVANLFSQNAGAQSAAIPYNLLAPTKTLLLPSELVEISGLSYLQDTVYFGVIQDEHGIVYIVSKQDGQVFCKIPFKEKGDFEDLAFVDGNIFVMQSSGKLTKISHWKGNENPTIEVIETGLQKVDDYEGLCYDAEKRVLLLASKGDPANAKERPVRVFSVDSLSLISEPLFYVHPTEIDSMLGIKKADEFFSPSAIAIHPKTKEYYVLSAAKKRLAVYSPSGKLVAASKIEKSIMPQPEGILFEPDGTLYISSEGKDDQPGKILKFNQL